MGNPTTRSARNKIAVVIPCFSCKTQILGVLGKIGQEVEQIYVIDDQCPEKTGEYVSQNCSDPRVKVIFHEVNLGVGGAVMSGYRTALQAGAHIIVKIDGDGQMDPALIPKFAELLLTRRADYVKGNRFYDIEGVKGMPAARLFGNAALSFLSKLSSGYWDIFDPTNGYTAIHTSALQSLDLDKIANRYFFESDILFRLNLVRAVVRDVPMKCIYGDEVSHLKIGRTVYDFAGKHLRNTLKRVFYNYFLRNFSVASLELLIGLASFTFGVTFGIRAWTAATRIGVAASDGTVMLAALPTLIGVQFLLSFVNFDMNSVPRDPLCEHSVVEERL